MLKLLVAGDLVPTQSNQGLFETGDMKTLLGDDLLKIWNDADYRVCNLETPLIDEGHPITKAGPNLKSPTNMAKGIKALKLDAVCLANNHIKDFDEEGVLSTVDVLTKEKVTSFGVGKNINEVIKYNIFKKDGFCVAVYACAEHEFSIADKKHGGANPYNDYYTNMDIRALKTKVDRVIVLYHGGREHYRYPSPKLQERCHLMVDNGADVVICQHSHCIGCCEAYNDATILYGQGNFIFDYADYECWQNSLIVKLSLDKASVKVEYIPILKNGNTIKLADKQSSADILKQFKERSSRILEPNAIEEEYKKEAQRVIAGYLGTFKSGYIPAIINYEECEAHNEIVLYGLKNCNIPMPQQSKVVKKRKFIGKVKLPNGKRKIYFLGLKIFSYKK